MPLLSATLTISEDEPALGLRETVRPRPDFKARHRYQCIYVIRDGKAVEWQKDLGPEGNFKRDQFHLLGGGENPDGSITVWETVGHLIDMADYLRENGFKSDEVYPKGFSRDMVAEYHDEVDRRRRQATRRSTFGYKYAEVR